MIQIVRFKDMEMPVSAALTAMLPAGRAERMQRYRQHSDRLRCLTAGLLAKRAAAEAFGCPDAEVHLPEGKPPYALCRGKKLYLSLSHAGNCVLCMRSFSPCGADLETVAPDSARDGLAEQFFCAPEAAWIAEGSTELQRHTRFTQIWTMKEAYLKYCGTGLRRPLDSFVIIPQADAAGFAVQDPAYAQAAALCCMTGTAGDCLYAAVSEQPADAVQILESDQFFREICEKGDRI